MTRMTQATEAGVGRAPVILPDGWKAFPAYVGFEASHRDYEADWQGEEDGWVGNGLCCWAMTKEELPALIAEIEAEHPHFATGQSK